MFYFLNLRVANYATGARFVLNRVNGCTIVHIKSTTVVYKHANFVFSLINNFITRDLQMLIIKKLCVIYIKFIEREKSAQILDPRTWCKKKPFGY